MADLAKFEERFKSQGELLPWQKSTKPFDFDQGFVSFVHRNYLPKALDKEPRDVERWQATQWINKAKFNEERLEQVLLQWQLYLEEWERKHTPVPESEPAVESEERIEFDPNTPEAQAARERVKQDLRLRGLA